MKANKFNYEYMGCQRSCSMAMSPTVAEETDAELPRPTVAFERSLIACHSNPAVVAEARRQHILRGFWQKLMLPISVLCEAIAEGARTHGEVLYPRSAGQLRRSTTSTEGV